MDGRANPDAAPEVGSLLSINLRRSARSGRFFLVYGTARGLVLGLSLAASGGDAFVAAFPLFLPVFAVVGYMGALVVFTNDRVKGVLE